MNDKRNEKYDIELYKCVGQHCIVIDMLGNKHEGKCVGVQYTHSNIVLMTETNKIIIKNVVSIYRARNKDYEQKGEVER